MLVKVIMPPGDGIMIKTPTCRAVGALGVWHIFSFCLEICYAFAYICKFHNTSKMGDAL